MSSSIMKKKEIQNRVGQVVAAMDIQQIVSAWDRVIRLEAQYGQSAGVRSKRDTME